MSRAAFEARIPLRCRWGRHAPEPVARWNDGYYFARCRRCGRDLVRTAYGRWQPPKGFRVVWRTGRPDNAVSAELVRAPEPAVEARPSGPPGEELPIQEVLRHLKKEEARPDEAEPAEPAEAPAPPAPRLAPSKIPDFMDDPNVDTAWRPPSAARQPEPAAAEAEPPSRPPRFSPAFAGLVSRARAPAEASNDDAARADKPDRRRMTMAVAGIVFMMLVVALAGWGQGSLAGQGEPGARTQSVDLGAGQPVFVAAGQLDCRADPAFEAMEVRRLVRGDAVRLIARDGGWASISHQGEQCWTLLRYLSVERPM